MICLIFYTDNKRGYTGFPERGGEDIPQAHTPLDIICVTSSALRKIEKHPHSWTFTSTHPLGHCLCDVIHIPRGGGGDRSRSRTLCNRLSVSGQVQGGGGGDHPCHPPWIRHWIKKTNPKIVPVPLLLNLYICPLNCLL